MLDMIATWFHVRVGLLDSISSTFVVFCVCVLLHKWTNLHIYLNSVTWIVFFYGFIALDSFLKWAELRIQFVCEMCWFILKAQSVNRWGTALSAVSVSWCSTFCVAFHLVWGSATNCVANPANAQPYQRFRYQHQLTPQTIYLQNIGMDNSKMIYLVWMSMRHPQIEVCRPQKYCSFYLWLWNVCPSVRPTKCMCEYVTVSKWKIESDGYSGNDSLTTFFLYAFKLLQLYSVEIRCLWCRVNITAHFVVLKHLSILIALKQLSYSVDATSMQ